MNLVVDIGNTLIKYYIFSKKNVILSKKSNDLDNLIFGIKDYIKLIEAIVISDVRGIDLSTITNNFDNKLIYKLKLDFKFPFKILYKSFDSIGEDRLGLMGSAYFNFPKKDVLVIDIGSCITYDLLTKDGVYVGGSISPGFSLRYKSLSEFTGKLPLIDFNLKTKNQIGNDTSSSIIIGVSFGIYYEIKGNINVFLKKYPDLTVILTGGDINLLPKSIKNTIFANQEFLAQGLNYLLDYNKN